MEAGPIFGLTAVMHVPDAAAACAQRSMSAVMLVVVLGLMMRMSMFLMRG